MARYSHLPIWKAAMDLAVHLEHAVRRFLRRQGLHDASRSKPAMGAFLSSSLTSSSQGVA